MTGGRVEYPLKRLRIKREKGAFSESFRTKKGSGILRNSKCCAWSAMQNAYVGALCFQHWSFAPQGAIYFNTSLSGVTFFLKRKLRFLRAYIVLVMERLLGWRDILGQ